MTDIVLHFHSRIAIMGHTFKGYKVLWYQEGKKGTLSLTQSYKTGL